MKYAPSKLIYHTLHSRPMHGYLPLFSIISAVIVIGCIRLFDVRVPVPLRPRAGGTMLYKNDELTQFRVRQNSALPLHLPRNVDPAEQIRLPKNTLPVRHEVPLIVAPPEALLPGEGQNVLLEADTPMPDVEKLSVPKTPFVAPRAKSEQVVP